MSNLTGFLPNVDGRSHIARRFYDIVAAVTSDQGGASELSEARTQLVRRFAAAAVMAEKAEADLANGKAIDVNEHALSVRLWSSLANRIGIDRRSATSCRPSPDYIEAVGSE